MCPPKIGTFKAGKSYICTVKICTVQVGTRKICPDQLGINQNRAL